jgi:hypothetical protein
MLVLFDQGTPVPIRPFLKGHTVQTTVERGWDTLENGELVFRLLCKCRTSRR